MTSDICHHLRARKDFDVELLLYLVELLERVSEILFLGTQHTLEL
jgi:hypothetical protein